MRSFISRFSAPFAFTVILILMLSCSLFESEKKTNLFFHYYSIDPVTLLDALNTRNNNVFVPISDEPGPTPYDQQITVPWSQADYLRIAKALYEYARGKTLDEWQLSSMRFSLGCEEYGKGFQNGKLEFFKVVKTSKAETRMAVIININPKDKYVLITENQYYPKLMSWSSIDPRQAHLSASEVLQIAENAGGKGKRLSVENACNISLLLSPNSADYEGWFIHYYRRYEGDTLFQINVDPESGQFHSP